MYNIPLAHAHIFHASLYIYTILIFFFGNYIYYFDMYAFGRHIIYNEKAAQTFVNQ